MKSRVIGALGVLAIAGLGVLAIGAPAQAEESVRQQPVKIDRTDAPCGPVELSTYAEAYIVVSADGETVASEALGAPVEIGPFDTPTVVRWRLFGGPERDNDYPLWAGHPATDGGLSNAAFIDAINAYGGEVGGFEWTLFGPEELDGNPFIGVDQWASFRVRGCVTPEEPTVELYDCATGTDAGELVIPTQDGVVYDADSGLVPPGTYEVTAEPADGYAFPADAATEWELTVPPVNGCPGEPGEPGDDGKDGEPGGTGGSDGGGDKGATLPQTGTFAQNAAGVGGGLVTLGASLGFLAWRSGRRQRNALLDGLTE